MNGEYQFRFIIFIRSIKTLAYPKFDLYTDNTETRSINREL